jgi:hypothetical protein
MRLHIVVVITALLLVIAGVRSAAITPPPLCMTSNERDRIRAIMIDGLDAALKTHTMQMFDIWMKDPSDQPRRAVVGMTDGISAHVRARANALKWDPPPC